MKTKMKMERKVRRKKEKEKKKIQENPSDIIKKWKMEPMIRYELYASFISYLCTKRKHGVITILADPGRGL